MEGVLLSAFLAFIFINLGWIGDISYSWRNPHLKNKVKWYFLSWVTVTFILGFFLGLFFIPIH